MGPPPGSKGQPPSNSSATSAFLVNSAATSAPLVNPGQPLGEAEKNSADLGDAPGKQTHSWASLFKDNRDPNRGHKLETIPVDGDIVELGKEDVYDVEQAWGSSLIAYIMGRFPGQRAVKEVSNSWNKPCSITYHASGWIVFRFQNDDDRDSVLANGPYASYGRPWILRKIPEFFSFDTACLSTIPLWIMLPGLPLQCWAPRALSRIASAIGTPVASDRCTVEKSRPAYARILVEVDMRRPLVRVVKLKLPNGLLREQRVTYENEPALCGQCGNLGHNTTDCRGHGKSNRSRSRGGRGRSKARKNVSIREPSRGPREQELGQNEASTSSGQCAGEKQGEKGLIDDRQPNMEDGTITTKDKAGVDETGDKTVREDVIEDEDQEELQQGMVIALSSPGAIPTSGEKQVSRMVRPDVRNKKGQFMRIDNSKGKEKMQDNLGSSLQPRKLNLERTPEEGIDGISSSEEDRGTRMTRNMPKKTKSVMMTKRNEGNGQGGRRSGGNGKPSH